MEIKESLDISSEDFYYDLCEGYLKPEDICKNPEDANKVNKALEVIEEFRNSCEEQIENFIQ